MRLHTKLNVEHCLILMKNMTEFLTELDILIC